MIENSARHGKAVRRSGHVFRAAKLMFDLQALAQADSPAS